MSEFRPTFVSHAHADNALCDRYVAALRARDIDIWYDRNDALAGHLLGTDIQRELQQRSAFVLLMTQQSLDSFWVQLELQAYLGLMAQDRSRILLPVLIGPCQPPPFLNALFWIDAQAKPFEQAIDAIVAALMTQSAPFARLPEVEPSPQIISYDEMPLHVLAPAPANSVPALSLTPAKLYDLGFRGYTVGGVECILPPICSVPYGDFAMGSKSTDIPSSAEEAPQHFVDVRAFAISQHPVTVRAYACAVRAGVVREPPASAGIDWELQEAQSWTEYPVVCVSWNDALAYVRWLAKTTGQNWRLPTEAEWEKAARGTDRRTYPWGNAFDKARCNTIESGFYSLTSVGSYPNGESPYHVQDMAGNIWEWTSSLLMPYPYDEYDGREGLDSTGDRVRRGGSFGNAAHRTRSASRSSSDPDKFYNTVGLRLVLGADDLLF